MGNGETRRRQALHSATHTILRPSRGVIERGRRLELGRTLYVLAWPRILDASDDSAYCYQLHYSFSYPSDVLPHFRLHLHCTRISSTLVLVSSLFPHNFVFRCMLHCSRSPASSSHCTVRIFGISLVPSSRPFGQGRVSLGVSTFTPAQRRTTDGQTKQMDWYVAFAVLFPGM